MPNRKFIQKLGFRPKENESDIFYKKYPFFGDYIIEADFQKNKFDFGSKIKSDSGTAQNFSQEENWVVLECVNRLLEKGYKPEDITLEKIYPTGHGTSGRLDILVKKDKKAYLMIECKTWGNEYQKALKKMQKDGGQLFTYFQQDRDTQYLMLYASEFNKGELNFESEIVKIEEHYREAGNVKDLYDRWNKLSKSNGIFDEWVNAYEFQNKALTINDLKIIKQEDSSFIFHRFLEILRQNVVSDKPNAFNKIFTLFLCKIVDEDRAKNEQLHFQYLEGEDDNISFQKRLTDLYKRGMSELLEKDVVDMGDEEFKKKFGAVDEKYKTEFLKILTEIRLKKNNEFAFKEVFDDLSFDENAKVVKQVVELLQEYQIRYNKKHQYLGDFFELLLTTGLKQESGQFFTPVPVAKYIIKSLPIKEIINDKISKGNPHDLIPFTIDYAAGSGHFLIESMESIQKMIDLIDEDKLNPQSAKKMSGWKKNQFEWAFEYVYGIEKDYRLVKTAKVGCYLHGDGLAKVIHGDGLGTFDKTSEYRGKLKEVDNDFSQDNKQFDLVISNPPYSVSAFKGNLDEENAKKSFDLFDRLTDQSSEIECLFIERTKQLLKDDGLAGIILPSSILSNTGIYTKTREILFKYFEIIGITELGSGTFMATGTNTVILFLRRRNNYEWQNIQSSIEKFFQNYSDITVNGIEHIFTKYVEFVWEGIKFEDYLSLCKNTINKNIENHEIYKEYEKKLKTKDRDDFQKKIIEKEQEKLLYFILAYAQKVILTKSGQKKEERKFLGYEFSNRRGYEGIHPIQRGKSIDECTKMYDSENQDDEAKANSYVYKAFLGKKNQKIHQSLEKNIFEISLIDLMTFDRVDFEKNISLSVKKKIKVESKWETVRLGDIVTDLQSGKRPEGGVGSYDNGIPSLGGEHIGLMGKISVDNIKYVPKSYFNQARQGILKDGDILICKDGALTGKIAFFDKKDFPYEKGMVNEHIFILRTASQTTQKYLFLILFSDYGQELLKSSITGQAQGGLNRENLLNIRIALPPEGIQKKIVVEIEKLEQKEKKDKKEFDKLKVQLIENANNLYKTEHLKKILSVCSDPVYGANERAIDGNPEKDFRYIRITDINDDGTLNDEWKTAEKTADKYILKEGDLLFARSGATAGKTFFYKTSVGKAIYAGYLILFRSNQKFLSPQFLNFVLKSDVYKNWVLGKRKGTAQPNINAQQFGSFEIPVPTISEQRKIVMEIEKIEKQIDLLKSNLQECSKLKKEVLKKYL